MVTNESPEMDRILQNPENVILSEGLDVMLESDEHEKSYVSTESSSERLTLSGTDIFEEDNVICYISSAEKEYTSKVIRMTRLFGKSSFEFKFVLFVPTLVLEDLFDECYLTLHINDYLFTLVENKKITLEGDLLTITTRRKFNETV